LNLNYQFKPIIGKTKGFR